MDKTKRFEGLKVMVTGGAGFIGSWLCEHLLLEGAEVVCVDNCITGGWQNIRHLKSNPMFMFVMYDVSNPKIVEDFSIAGFDIIFHWASLAAPADFGKHPIMIMDTNLIGTKNMLELARRNDARLVFASSSEVYGNIPAEQIPVKESYTGNVNIIGVRGCYDEGKRGGEAYCMAYLREFGVDVRITRIHNTFGERMQDDGRAVPKFIKMALKGKPIPIFGDGTQTRCFTYVDDLVEGILAQSLADGITGVPINFGSQHEITVLQLAERILDLTNSKSELKFYDWLPDEPMRRKPDITRAKKLLNWEPAITLDEGLRWTIDYWKEKVL
jgi:UDP-glucuronate decarboxylase